LACLDWRWPDFDDEKEPETQMFAKPFYVHRQSINFINK